MKRGTKRDAKENPFATKGKSRRPHIVTAKQKVDERRRGKDTGGIRKQDVDAKTSQTILAQKQLETDKLFNRSLASGTSGTSKILKGKKRFILGSDDENDNDELVLKDGSKFSEIEMDKSNMKDLGHRLMTEIKDDDSDNDDEFKALATSTALDSLTKKERLKAMIKQTKIDKDKKKDTREEVERLTTQSNNRFTDIMGLLMSQGMVDGKDPTDTRRLEQRPETATTTSVEEGGKMAVNDESSAKLLEPDQKDDGLTNGEAPSVYSSSSCESNSIDESSEEELSSVHPADSAHKSSKRSVATDDEDEYGSSGEETEEEGSDVSPSTSNEAEPAPSMAAGTAGAEAMAFEEFSDDDDAKGDAESENEFDSELGYETMMVNEQAAPSKLDGISNLETAIPDEIMDFYMHANEAIDQWSCFKKQGNMPLPPTFSTPGEAGLDENLTTEQFYIIQFNIWKSMFDLWINTSASANLAENSLNGIWSLEASNFGLMIVLSVIEKLKSGVLQNEKLYDNIILKIVNSLANRYKDIFASCKRYRSTDVPMITKGSEVSGLVEPKSQDQLNEEGQYNSSLAGAVVAYVQVVFQPIMTEVFKVLNGGETPKSSNYVLPKDSKKNGKIICSLFEELDKVKCTMAAQEPELTGKFSKIVTSITPEFERVRTRQAIKRMKAAKEGFEEVDAFLESKKEKDLKRKRRDQARLMRRETEAEAEEAAKSRAFRLQARGKEQQSFDRAMNEQKATIAQISTSQAQSGDTSLGAHRIMKDRKKLRKLGPNAEAVADKKGKRV